MRPTPLFAAEPLRGLLSFGLAFLAVGLALFGLLAIWWAGDLTTLLLSLLAAAGLCCASWATLRGAWAPGPAGYAERAGAAALVLMTLVLAVLAFQQAVVDLRDREVFELDPYWIWVELTVAAAAIAGVALLLAALPLAASRKRAAAVLGGTVAAGAAVALAVGAVAYADDGCDGYRPDRAQWLRDLRDGGNDGAARVAAKLLRCRTLDGKTRAEVVAMLGPGQRSIWEAPPTMAWTVGLVNDYMGPGDGQYFTVTFQRGWVDKVMLSDPDQAVR